MLTRHSPDLRRLVAPVVILLASAGLLAACGQRAPTAQPTPATAIIQAPSPTILPTSPPEPTATPAPAAPLEPMAISPVGMDGVLVMGTDGQPWWNDSIFYEVFVRSFYDSDGDGVGDLNGLIEKLDYLNDGNAENGDDLGITGIWLMPIAQSPSYHGYDVVDYYQVDDEYGTAEDLRRLVAEAHRRGIRVIVDLVLNHTSAQHPWFQEALDSNAPRRDWYVWADEQPEGPFRQYWRPAPDGDYYYAFFWDQMPDLNYNNPDVTAEMEAMSRFWLEEMGVDGFRLDAIKYLIEQETPDGRIFIEHAPATHDWLRGYHDFYKAIAPDALTVGEVWSDSETVATYIGDQVDLAFDFSVASAILESAVGGDSRAVARAQALAHDTYPPNQFATFLANHDQNRTRSRLLRDEQAKIAATLQLAYGGVPFIYYGEEIGMQGEKPDENIRRPMQWTEAGGFSDGEPWNAYYEDVAERNVAGQAGDPASLLSHYRALIRLRNEHEALRVGDWWAVQTGNRALHAFLRASDEEIILVLANLSGKPVAASDYGLSLAAGPMKPGLQPVPLLADAGGAIAAPTINDAGGFEAFRPLDTLAPYGSYLIQFRP